MRLLKTKLSKPPIHTTIIKRPNITKLLEDYCNYKLILVSAPAGSGKSTVINAWLETIDTKYSWYSLDTSDNTIQQFLSYFIACLDGEEVFKSYQISELIASLASLGPDSLMRSIINVLYETKIPFTIILDDYHFIHNKEIHQMIMMFIEHLPSHIQLLIITREDPPLFLAKLRVSRLLLEIRMQELQFSNEETTEFMANSMGLKMSPHHIEQINLKTEGWIAGIQLTALSLQNQQDYKKLLNEFTGNHYIVDYLLEEVLNHMDARYMNFLLGTSILSQINSDLCDNLLDLNPGSSEDILRVLSQNNTFIMPLDYHRQWFRYHHLFRDLLLSRLENTSFDIHNLHYKASIWFEANSITDLAINHALEAEAFTFAAKLVENIWIECDRNLQAQYWIDQFEKLPEDIVDKRPVLLMGYAWALLDTGHHLECKVWLEKSQNLYDAIQAGKVLDYEISDQEQYDLLPSTIASAHCYLAIGEGRFNDMFSYAKKAFNHKAKMTSHRSGVLHMLMGLALWSIGDMTKAKDEIDQSILAIKKSNNTIAMSTCEIVRIDFLVDTGQFKLASDLLNQVISCAEKNGKISLVLASFHLIYSRIHLALGNIDEAIKAHQLSKKYGLKYCLPDYWYKYYQHQAILQIYQGLFDSAVLSLDEADSHYYLNPLVTRTSIKGLRGYLNILMNKLDDAALCFDNIFAEQDIIYKSIFLAKVGKEDESVKILTRLYEKAESQRRTRSISEILFGQAVISKENGRIKECIGYISQAIVFVNSSHYIEPLLRYREVLGDIYPNLSLSNEIKTYLSLDFLDDSYTVFQANQELQEPLTPRELEIIQLLSNGYSNQEICDELFLALSTVKGYNQNLFGKLDVHSRTEAISVARKIGLIK